MQLEKIRISAFGSLHDRDFTFAPGMNIIEGENESGKSTLAMFIKFAFYGLSGKTDAANVSERRRYISWSRSNASGSIEFTCSGKREGRYRIERALHASTSQSGREGYREALRVTDCTTGTQIKIEDSPGEWFFGVPEEVFLNTIFVRQLYGTGVNGDGIGESIENLLLSGNESLDTGRALKRLDEARRQLKPKNRSAAGEINQLEKRRDELEAALAKAVGSSAELISTEASAADTAAKYSELEAKIKRLGEQVESADAAETLTRIDEIKSLDSRIAELKRHVDTVNAEYALLPNRDFLSSVRTAGRELTDAAAELTHAEQSLADASQSNDAKTSADALATMTDGEIGAIKKQEAARIMQATSVKKTLFSAGALVMALGLLATASSIALNRIAADISFYVMIFAGILIAAAVTLFVSAAVKNRTVSEICDKWGALSFAKLDEAIDDRVEAARRAYESDETRAAVSKSAEDARAVFSEKYKNACRFIEAYNGAGPQASLEPNADFDSTAAGEKSRQAASKLRRLEECSEKYITAMDETARALDKLESRRSLLIDAVTKLYGRADLQAIAEKLSAMAANAKSVPPEEAANMRRELDFSRQAYQTMGRQLHEKEVRLASLKATAVDPCAIEQKLSEVKATLAECTFRHDALVMAGDALSDASMNIRSGVAPRLAKDASERFAQVTCSRYDSLGVDGAMNLTFTSDGVTRDSYSLSAGTADAVYICLRLALADLFYKDDPPPLIFDEITARLDDERASAVLSVISGAGQSLIFTCTDRESRIVGGGANYINM